MVEVRWTFQSLEDIENIAEFIAKDSIRYSNQIVEDFFDRVLILEKNPQAGPIVPEILNEKIRQLTLGNYRIIYYLKTENQIDILTVHHSSKLIRKKEILKNI